VTDFCDIIDGCIRTGKHPRIMNLDGLYSDGGYRYKLLKTLESMIDNGMFISSMKQGLYVDGIFDLGIRLSKYGGTKCTLYRFTDSVPDRLYVCRFNGDSEEISESVAECSEDCRKHLSSLSCNESTEITDCFDVPSPYGECIPVKGYYLDSGFEIPDSSVVETDRAYRTSTFKYKKTCLNKPFDDPPKQNPSGVVRRKGGSRRGEVWWVKNLEFGEPGVTSHGFKNRPVIIDMVVSGIAHFYMCTTNNITYDYPKYRLKEPIEDGLTKEPVYVTLQEREIPEGDLSRLVGFLTDVDMEVVFNPPKDDPYWKRQYRRID